MIPISLESKVLIIFISFKLFISKIDLNRMFYLYQKTNLFLFFSKSKPNKIFLNFEVFINFSFFNVLNKKGNLINFCNLIDHISYQLKLPLN